MINKDGDLLSLNRENSHKNASNYLLMTNEKDLK